MDKFVTTVEGLDKEIKLYFLIDFFDKHLKI